MLTLCDVGPRDGLQNEAEALEPAVRADLVNRLAAAGLPRVEAVSFVRDDRVPQMAGAEEVVAAIERRDGTEYSGLVLNEQGYERFARLGARPRQRHARRDRGVQPAQRERVPRRRRSSAVERILARADRPATVTISVAFGCPFEGRVDPGRVARAGRAVRGSTRSSSRTRSGSRCPARCASWSSGRRPPASTGTTRATPATRTRSPRWSAGATRARRLGRRPRRLPLRAARDAATSRPRTSSTCSRARGSRPGVDLDALIRISEWLEAVLGRRLEGQLYRAGTWAGSGGRARERSTARSISVVARSASWRPRAGSPCGRPRSCRPARCAALLHGASTSSVRSSDSKRKSTWLRTTSFSISTPGSSTIRVGEAARARAGALDELGDARRDRGAQRGVDGEAARATRELRHPVHLVAHALSPSSWIRYGGGDRHRRAVRLGVRRRTRSRSRTGRSATCGRPSSTSRPARRPRRGGGSAGEAAAHRPKAPSTWSHAPARSRRVRDLGKRVERAGVHLSGLRADDRRASAPRERGLERIGSIRPWSSAASGVGAPSPSSRSARSTVTWRFSPTSTRTRRRAGEPVAARRPSRPRSSTWNRAAASAGHVRHLCPGDEADRSLEQGVRAARRATPRVTSSTTEADGPADVEARVLVPGGGEPVRRERGRQRAADHEAEVAAAAHRDDARLGRGRELPHDLRGSSGSSGNGPPSSVAQLAPGSRQGRPAARRACRRSPRPAPRSA